MLNQRLFLPTHTQSSCFHPLLSLLSQNTLGHMVKFLPQKVKGVRRSNASSEIPYGSVSKQRKRMQGSTQEYKEHIPVNVLAKLTQKFPWDGHSSEQHLKSALKVTQELPKSSVSNRNFNQPPSQLPKVMQALPDTW